MPTAAYACPPDPQDADAQMWPCRTDRAKKICASGLNGCCAAPAAEADIPRLLKTYLTIGARIAAPPAWDREFRTIDFLTLLDLNQLSAAARNRFLAPFAS